MAVGSKYEMKLVGVLLVALVAILAVVKVEAALECANLDDCDEGVIVKKWTGSDCEGNVSYSVMQRANESIGCVPWRDHAARFSRSSCDASSASKEFVERVYKDSSCNTEVKIEKWRLETCRNRPEWSHAHFCSKADAATKEVSWTSPGVFVATCERPETLLFVD